MTIKNYKSSFKHFEDKGIDTIKNLPQYSSKVLEARLNASSGVNVTQLMYTFSFGKAFFITSMVLTGVMSTTATTIEAIEARLNFQPDFPALLNRTIMRLVIPRNQSVQSISINPTFPIGPFIKPHENSVTTFTLVIEADGDGIAECTCIIVGFEIDQGILGSIQPVSVG